MWPFKKKDEFDRLLEALGDSASPEFRASIAQDKQELADFERLMAIIKRLKKSVKADLYAFSIDRVSREAWMHPALAAELEKPENSGPKAAMWRWSQMPNPLPGRSPAMKILQWLAEVPGRHILLEYGAPHSDLKRDYISLREADDTFFCEISRSDLDELVRTGGLISSDKKESFEKFSF